MNEKRAIVSACLVGLKTRYNGTNSPDEELIEKLKKGELIPLCPEQLGGLPTPREPMQFTNGDGYDVIQDTADVVGIETKTVFSNNLLRGAEEVLNISKKLNIKKAYLRENSPSCGVNKVWIDGNLKEGKGVTTALLELNGVEVIGVI